MPENHKKVPFLEAKQLLIKNFGLAEEDFAGKPVPEVFSEVIKQRGQNVNKMFVGHREQLEKIGINSVGAFSSRVAILEQGVFNFVIQLLGGRHLYVPPQPLVLDGGEARLFKELKASTKRPDPRDQELPEEAQEEIMARARAAAAQKRVERKGGATDAIRNEGFWKRLDETPPKSPRGRGGK